MPTKIEWCQETINPLPGCTKISEGCQNCYAVRQANRFKGTEKYHGLVEHGNWTGQVNWWPDDLEKLVNWKKPRMVFINSMGDLFHPSVKDEWIDAVFRIMTHPMSGANHHIYLLLTKRPERILSGHINRFRNWPNVWLGVTAENQKRADERIPILLQIPAAVRWVSFEPMLSYINIEPFLKDIVNGCTINCNQTKHICRLHAGDCGKAYRSSNGIDWVVCGGESGPGARPMHPDWTRSLRDQCVAADVPFFFKSWGDWEPSEIKPEIDTCYHKISDGSIAAYTSTTKHHWWGGSWGDGKPLSVWVGKKKSGREIDGRTWDQYPVTE